MRKSVSWFRMPSDLIDNPSLLTVSDTAALFFVHLLCLKSAGILDEINHKNCPPETKRHMLALRLRKSEAELNQILRELADVELVDFDTAQPVQWEKYAKKTAPKKPREKKTTTEIKAESTKTTENEKKKLNTVAQEVIKFDFQKGQWQNITTMHIERWQALYPQVNIEAELERMCVWLVAKQQPRSHYFLFVDNWLSRAQSNKTSGKNHYKNDYKNNAKTFNPAKNKPQNPFNPNDDYQPVEIPAFLKNYKNPLDIPMDIDYGVSGYI